MSTLGLITAIPEELAEIGAHFETREIRKLAGITFHLGSLDGRETVAVETGIGKVNAALTTTLLCELFGVKSLIFSGVAGGLDPALSVGDVVIGRRLVMHDYGAVVDGKIKTYQPGNMPLPGFPEDHGYDLDPAQSEAVMQALEGLELPEVSAEATGGAPHFPSVRLGTILTGDAFVNCERTRLDLHERFQAHAVEMEGAAVAQVAQRYGIKPVVVRALSDLAGQESHMDFGAFVTLAAKIAAAIVVRLAKVA